MNRCECCGSFGAPHRYGGTLYCRQCRPLDAGFQCISCEHWFDADRLAWSGFHSSLCVDCATPEIIDQQIRQHARREVRHG